jgi:hypothetical protein
MTNYQSWQPSSKLGRSIVTQTATAQPNATQFGSQTRQIRITSTLALWITIDSTAVVTANSASALIPANAAPEYFFSHARTGVELHQHKHIDRIRLASRDDLMTGDDVRIFPAVSRRSWTKVQLK